MLTFADLTTNKTVSLQEFRKIENSMNKELFKRIDKMPIIDFFSIDIQMSKENEKFYTILVTDKILKGLLNLNFPIKNIVKYSGKSLDEIEHKENICLSFIKKFSKKYQNLPSLDKDQTFIFDNNILKQASLLV